jgi:orotidine-5'-phosphate decarboxylase
MIEVAQKRLIFALDVDSCAAAERWAEQLCDKVGLFKVGKQLFTRCGPDIVRRIQERGGQVFLDLKYHDIPNTVAQATVEACRLGVKMVNVHALGGPTMMRETVAAVNECCATEKLERPILLAVTILTSSDQESLRAVGIDHSVDEMVPHLARLAQQAGLDGVVASPREVPLIRRVCGNEFVIVTPGVRPAFASVDDQKRITSPAEAIAAGADYLVVGRPIAKASDSRLAATMILEEMAQALVEVDCG